MGLFGKRSEKAAAAEAESERLMALSGDELAIAVMAAFGPNGIGAKGGHREGPLEVVSWLLPDGSVKFRQPLLAPVIDALGVLEHANLLTRASFGSRGQASTYHATALGTAALTEGTVGQHLTEAR